MDKIRELTNRSKSQSMNKRIKAINTYIVGWVGYYRLADTRSVFQALDEWLRRRLRMCYLKHGRNQRPKERN
ncbi:group II intron maturase-specific domain-containing protein [Desulforamulus ferrireducens]